MSFGQPKAGTELAPAAMRAAGLQAALTTLGWRYSDVGDVQLSAPASAQSDAGASSGTMRHGETVGLGNESIHRAAHKSAASGNFVLTLGGDHSVAMGSISGIMRARPDLRVVWVDAHADINTPEVSTSGNVHGMPVSFLCRLFDPSRYPGYQWLSQAPKLELSKIVYIGLRDVDAAERKLIKSLGVRAYTMHEIDRFGIGKVMEMALDHVLKPSGFSDAAPTSRGQAPLHLSFDIDAVDPTVAPSTGTAVPGGLNYREAHYVCEACAETGLLGSMDMVEVNPQLVPGQGGIATVTAAVQFIGSALGRTILPRDSND